MLSEEVSPGATGALIKASYSDRTVDVLVLHVHITYLFYQIMLRQHLQKVCDIVLIKMYTIK